MTKALLCSRNMQGVCESAETCIVNCFMCADLFSLGYVCVLCINRSSLAIIDV